MDAKFRQYLFGAIFLAAGIYYLIKNDYLEGSLYALAGLSFVSNTLINEPRLGQYKNAMITITWVLIIITALVFLWLIQFKFL